MSNRCVPDCKSYERTYKRPDRSAAEKLMDSELLEGHRAVYPCKTM